MPKRKIHPATGKHIKVPSDFKKRRCIRSAEQNAARRQKGLYGGKFRPNKNAKVYF